jgi:hypothetical protein
MKRRLYFLFPDPGNARIVVDELQSRGMHLRDMHTLARTGINLEGLPAASRRQRNDAGAPGNRVPGQ